MNAPTPALVARPERLRLVGQRRQILALMHQRLMFGMLVYGGIIALIVLRLIWLAAFGDHAGRKGGAIDLAPERGDIVDRDGQPLARTIDAWTIACTRRRSSATSSTWRRKLAELMPEKDAANIWRCCARTSLLSISAAAPRPRLVAAINALGEPGLALDREPDRLYPQTSLAAHVVGYTDIDGNGSRRDRARIRRAAARSRPARRADHAVDLQPDPAGARA